jgi:hypothetical protein
MNNMIKCKKLAALFIFLFSLASAMKALGQTDTISVRKKNLLTGNIKEGTSQFLSFLKNEKTKAIVSYGIQERTVKFSKRSGRAVIIVTQHRHVNDSTMSKYVYTVSDRQNFQTIYDYTQRIISGIEAYDYKDDSVTGSDTITHNTKTKFRFDFKGDLPYCSELNVETISALPLKRKGQKLVVTFYEPGIADPPQYHEIEVVGTERLIGVNQTLINCWVVKMTYDGDNHDYFWISKTGHEFLKLESHSPGMIFSRVKLFNSDASRFFN